MDLHARIALVTLNGFGAAKNFRALAAVDHFRAHFSSAGINADRFRWHARGKECRRHPVRRPGLLRARLEDEADLQRNDRHPECMDARRIGRQHQAEHRRLGLIADDDAA